MLLVRMDVKGTDVAIVRSPSSAIQTEALMEEHLARTKGAAVSFL